MLLLFGYFDSHATEETESYYTKKDPLGLEREETLYDPIPGYLKKNEFLKVKGRENALLNVSNITDMAMVRLKPTHTKLI